MGLTVSTVAPTLRLTTRAAIKAELSGTFTAADDLLIDSFLDQASAAIVSHTRRMFARESYTETLGGYGDIRLQLARTPVVAVTVLTIMSNVVTDFGIEDEDKGWLYMRCFAGTSGFSWQRTQFPWTAGRYIGLSGSGAWLDQGTPLPDQEIPSISVDYTAGYILPSQFLSAVTISAANADSSFNDSASGFPVLLKAGDIVETSGFTNAANNSRWLVTGTPTTAKIVVTGTVTTEAAGATVAVKFRPPSSHRPFDDVEKACIEVVKSWYLSRKDDSNIVEKHAGPMGLRYGEGASGNGALPPTAVALLRNWVRAA